MHKITQKKIISRAIKKCIVLFLTSMFLFESSRALLAASIALNVTNAKPLFEKNVSELKYRMILPNYI
jgi:hypothetical protein